MKTVRLTDLAGLLEMVARNKWMLKSRDMRVSWPTRTLDIILKCGCLHAAWEPYNPGEYMVFEEQLLKGERECERKP